MADTISVTSKLPLGFPAAEGLTIMPGTTDVDAKAWAAWKATKPGIIDSGDVVETKVPEVEKPALKADLPAPVDDKASAQPTSESAK